MKSLRDILPWVSHFPGGCLKSRNPLTAKVAKDLRKDRKDFIISGLILCPLRNLSVLCG